MVIKLPMLCSRFKLTTIEERNDKGTWFGWDIEKIGAVDELEKLTDNTMFERDTTTKCCVRR